MICKFYPRSSGFQNRTFDPITFEVLRKMSNAL